MTVPNRPFDSVLLISFGGPQGPKDIRPFLENVLRGRRVAPQRMEEVAHHYELFGGVSPITALHAAAGGRAARSGWRPRDIRCRSTSACATGTRSSRDTLRQMSRTARGARSASSRRRSSPTRAASSIARTSSPRATALRHDTGGDIEVTYVNSWFDHPRFIDANAAHVRDAARRLPADVRSAARLVFTAHSIPLTMAERSRYREQLLESSRLVAERSGIADWALVYPEPQRPPRGSLARVRTCANTCGASGPQGSGRRAVPDRVRLPTTSKCCTTSIARPRDGLPRDRPADDARRGRERRSRCSST